MPDCDEHARDHAIMALSFFGVRKTEQMGAKWEDMDWMEGSLHIQRSAWRGELAEGAKNTNSVRKAWLGKMRTKMPVRTEKRRPTVARWL